MHGKPTGILCPVTLAALLVAMLALAGCAGAGTGKDASVVQLGDGEQVELLQPETTEAGRGAISGVVVDEAIRPLAGVNVTLLGPQVQATTDDQGLFLFDGLAPGLYTLSAAAPMFLPVQTTAEAKVGETAKVRMVLAADATPRPYHTVLKFEGFIEASFGALNQVYQLFVAEHTGIDVCQCQFYYQTESLPETQIIEVTWEPSVENPAMPPDGYWAIWDDNSSDYHDDGCENPCFGRVDGGFGPEARNFHTDFWLDYYWVQYQQRFTQYLTLFYVEKAPEGWSFIAGNT